MENNRAQSLNQYLQDVNSGIDTVTAFRSHKARVGELDRYELRVRMQEAAKMTRRAERLSAGCAA